MSCPTVGATPENEPLCDHTIELHHQAISLLECVQSRKAPGPCTAIRCMRRAFLIGTHSGNKSCRGLHCICIP